MVLQKNLYDSFIVYFDHIQGRIQRYLLNKGLNDSNSDFTYIFDSHFHFPIIDQTAVTKMEPNEEPKEVKQDLLDQWLTEYVQEVMEAYGGKVTPDLLLEIKRQLAKARANFNGRVPLKDKYLSRIILNLVQRYNFQHDLIESPFTSPFYPYSFNYTIHTGKLDSLFFNYFLESLFKTYLAVYPNTFDLRQNISTLPGQGGVRACCRTEQSATPSPGRGSSDKPASGGVYFIVKKLLINKFAQS